MVERGLTGCGLFVCVRRWYNGGWRKRRMLSKEQVIEQISVMPQRSRSKKIRENPELAEWFEHAYPGAPIEIASYALLRGESPMCVVCGKPVKAIRKKTCSHECRVKMMAPRRAEIDAAREKTMLEKYGVRNVASSSMIQEKRLNTMLEKYGALVSPKTVELARARASDMNAKSRITIQEKYGVKYPSQIPGTRAKQIESLQKKYGVSHQSKIPSVIQKRREDAIAKLEALFPDTITIQKICADPTRAAEFEHAVDDIYFHCHTCGTDEVVNLMTAKWRATVGGSPCRVCSGVSVGSVKQKKLLDFIQNLGIETQSNYRMKDHKEIDIMCADRCIGFEFDGLFWHNESRVGKYAQIDKTNMALDAGVDLIHVFEDEWDSRQTQVKNKIKQIFGTETLVDPSLLTVAPIEVGVASEFYKLHAIDSVVNGDITVGIYHDGLLIGAGACVNESTSLHMTSWCAIPNLPMSTAVSMMCQYLSEQHPTVEIYVEFDKRWEVITDEFQRHFTHAGDTAPRVWYTVSEKRSSDASVFAHRKEIHKIWDCGTTIWQYKIE